MNGLARYDDVLADVIAELSRRVEEAVRAGIDPDAIVLDPGLGFAKESEHNWQLLAGLDQLLALGHPVLVGASRKRFLGAVLADGAGEPRPVDQRDGATDAVTAIAAVQGVWAVRVHDVLGSKDAVRVARAWRHGHG
jgi:dihydropteroate synthase